MTLVNSINISGLLPLIANKGHNKMTLVKKEVRQECFALA